VQLLGAELYRFACAMILRLLQRGFQEQLPEQFWVVEVLRVALQQSYGGEFGLLRVQILGLGKLKQRTDVVGLCWINDDDALTLLELVDDVVAVQRGQHGHGDGHEEPEPRQPVALGEQLCRVKLLPGGARGCAVAGGCFTRVEVGGFHRFQ